MRRAATLLTSMLLLGCAHARPPAGASGESARERSLQLADGVRVTATRWDTTLVAMAAAEHDEAVPGDDEAGVRERLAARWTGDATAFTVLLEIAARSDDRASLADPASWWFRLVPGRDRHGGAGGQAPESVEVIAIDRFPAQGGGAHHRVALQVRFKGGHEGPLTLRVGPASVRTGAATRSHAAVRREPLGRPLARKGAALRW